MRTTMNRRQGPLARSAAAVGLGVPVLFALAAGPLTAARLAGAVVALVVPFLLLLPATIPRWWCAAALAGVPAVTVLQAGAGGIGSAVAALLVAPAVWFGLVGTHREQAAGVVVLVAACVGPMLVVGAPDYPVAWPQAGLVVALALGAGVTMTGVAQEVTRATDALQRQATSDELSGLLNRRGFRLAAEAAVARCAEHGRRVTVIALDLDDFKRVNDTLGHVAGDRCIEAMGTGLRAALRDRDVSGRIGGDEFLALLPRAGSEAALAAVTRLRRSAPDAGPFSAGVAEQREGEALDALLRRADRALYDAKAAGRGGTVVDRRPAASPAA